MELNYVCQEVRNVLSVHDTSQVLRVNKCRFSSCVSTNLRDEYYEIVLELMIVNMTKSISIVKPTRCTIFEFIEYHLHVSDCLSAHHQEFKTVHTASGICHTG
jgi:hypothetical protein